MKLLEIARTLMSGAKLLLMDEPIAGVNPTLAHQILDFITRLKNEQGITFFIIEHRLDIAMKYVDYVYAMARGRLIAEGSPEEVVSNPLVIDSYLGG
jgi:branched-chain amino acid transport system ATP-binding protein